MLRQDLSSPLPYGTNVANENNMQLCGLCSSDEQLKLVNVQRLGVTPVSIKSNSVRSIVLMLH